MTMTDEEIEKWLRDNRCANGEDHYFGRDVRALIALLQPKWIACSPETMPIDTRLKAVQHKDGLSGRTYLGLACYVDNAWMIPHASTIDRWCELPPLQSQEGGSDE